jgi:hypothetical protein
MIHIEVRVGLLSNVDPVHVHSLLVVPEARIETLNGVRVQGGVVLRLETLVQVGL